MTGALPPEWLVEDHATVVEEYGRARVQVDGRDATMLTGSWVVVDSWSLARPYRWERARVGWRGVRPGEVRGQGRLRYLADYARVRIWIEHPGTGVPMESKFQGNVASWSLDAEGTLWADVIGLYYEEAYTVLPPSADTDAEDIGTLIPAVVNDTPSRIHWVMPEVRTGILSRKRGAWQSRMSYVSDLLSTAWTEDGRQWTMWADDSGRPYLTLEIPSRTWTVTHGTPGLDDSGLAEDMLSQVNRVWGYGVDPHTHGGWRGTLYPWLADGKLSDDEEPMPVWRPLAADTRVEKWVWDAYGRRTGENPAYEPHRRPVDRQINFGDISLAQAKGIARGIVAREGEPLVAGTVTLEVDPEEGCRFDVEPGHVLVVPGTVWGTLSLHVSHVDVSLESGTVSLDVATRPVDAMTLDAILQRDRDARDPGRRGKLYGQEDLPSNQVTWDSEAGTGRVPTFHVPGGQQAGLVVVPMSQRDKIVRTYLKTATPARFAVAVFNKRVTVEQVHEALGESPLTATDPRWRTMAGRLRALGCIAAWGSQDQPCGYGDGSLADNSPLTGVLDDTGSWDWWTPRGAAAWIVVYAEHAVDVTGRLYVEFQPDGPGTGDA